MSSAPTTRAPSRSNRRRRRFGQSSWSLLLYIAPAALFIGWFTYYPIASGAPKAFQSWNLYDINNTPWIGFGNFQALASDPTMAIVLKNSLIWVVASIVPQLLIGLTLAVFMWKTFKGRGVYQALVFFPWAMSGFLIGIIFRWMFNSEFGVINDLLVRFGLIDTPVPWLADPELAMLFSIIANIWYGVTFFAIMILAALQSVDQEMLEAGEVDGAGFWRSLFMLVLPSIRYTVALTVLLRVIWIFNFPDIIYAMTGGGPANRTQIMTTWLVDLTQQGAYGNAAALGLMIVAILCAFAVFYLLAMRGRAK